MTHTPVPENHRAAVREVLRAFYPNERERDLAEDEDDVLENLGIRGASLSSAGLFLEIRPPDPGIHGPVLRIGCCTCAGTRVKVEVVAGGMEPLPDGTPCTCGDLGTTALPPMASHRTPSGPHALTPDSFPDLDAAFRRRVRRDHPHCSPAELEWGVAGCWNGLREGAAKWLARGVALKPTAPSQDQRDLSFSLACVRCGRVLGAGPLGRIQPTDPRSGMRCTCRPNSRGPHALPQN